MAVRRRRSTRAFTLVEMIVATIVLAVGVVAGLTAIGSATRATAVAVGYSTAATLVHQKFAEIEANPDSLTGGDQQGDFGDQYPGYTYSETIETTDFSGLYKVTVVINWGTGSAQRSAQFVSYEQQPAQTSTTGTTGATGQ